MTMFSRAGLPFILLCYFISGVGLTCYNKWLLGRDWYGFGFPILLIFCHMVSNFLLSAVTVFLVLRPSLQQSTFYPSHLSLSTFLLRFCPIGALFALDITLTNLSFQHVPVSLTEVIKGFSPAALMLYEMAQPHSTPSIAKAMVIVMLSAGIALTSMGELEFNEADDLFIGGAAAVGALVSGVVKFILLERLLLEEDNTAQAEGAGSGAAVSTGGGGAVEEGREMRVVGKGKKRRVRGRVQGAEYQQVGALEDEADVDGPLALQLRVKEAEELKEGGGDQAVDDSRDSTQDGGQESEEEEEKQGGDVEPTVMRQSPLRRRSPFTSPPSSTADDADGGDLPPLRLPVALTAHGDVRLARSASVSSTASMDMVAIDPSSMTAQSPSLRGLGGPPLPPPTTPGGTQPPPPSHAGHRRLHPMLSLFYFSPVAAAVLAPAFAGFEARRLMFPSVGAKDFTQGEVVWVTGGLVGGGAVLAFALNVSELVVIQTTSALTLCVVATAKFLLVVAMTTWLFGGGVSWVKGVGCGVSVLGVAAYNWMKYREVVRRREGTGKAEGEPVELELQLWDDEDDLERLEMEGEVREGKRGKGTGKGKAAKGLRRDKGVRGRRKAEVEAAETEELVVAVDRRTAAAVDGPSESSALAGGVDAAEA